MCGFDVKVEKISPQQDDVLLGIRSANFSLEENENLNCVEIKIYDIINYFDKKEIKGTIVGSDRRVTVVIPYCGVKNVDLEKSNTVKIYFDKKDVCVFKA